MLRTLSRAKSLVISMAGIERRSFKLTNGQIWQQVEYDYEYEYAFQPEVTIYKTAGGYKMKVEGMDDTIYVRRLK